METIKEIGIIVLMSTKYVHHMRVESSPVEYVDQRIYVWFDEYLLMKTASKTATITHNAI